MIYLFIGENTPAKQEQITSLKAKWDGPKDSLGFDYEVIYGHHLDPKDLKKSLLSLPAIAAQRLIFIHECEKLNEHCKEILLEFITAKPKHAILILDCFTLSEKDSIWTKICSCAKVYEAPKVVKQNVFDLTNKMTAGRSAEALKILDGLFDDGLHPLQIMGGIVWAWGNERRRVSAKQYEKGLRDLQEADLNIKRSRLKPEQALEVLVVKLASLKN